MKTVVTVSFLALVPIVYFGSTHIYNTSYYSPATSTPPSADTTADVLPNREVVKATHIKTPERVKAIYMTACVAATPSLREKLLKIADETEINSIVIDIKDYSGTISFEPENSILKENKGTGCRTKDMREFIEKLHQHGVYVIGRITVFQDPYYTKKRPDLAVRKLSDGGYGKIIKALLLLTSARGNTGITLWR